MGKKLTFLDLFAGAGGLSEGFIKAGFEPVAHVESDTAACYTLRTRMSYHWLASCGKPEFYVKYLKGDLSRTDFYAEVSEKVLGSVINEEIGTATLPKIFHLIDELLDGRQLDLIIGGPPCQAYSLVGRSRDKNKMIGDKRNYLYVYYAEFLKRYRPKYFVFENVMGLLSAKDKDGNPYLAAMIDLFRKNGYETEYEILSSEEYGVLQSRKRVIIVGKRGKDTGFYPVPDKWNPEVNVQEIFCDLPALKAGEGVSGPVQVNPYNGKWQVTADIRNENIPVTLHQARPNNEQDLEIYRIAVELWNSKKARLNYNALPSRLKTHKNRESFKDRFKVVASDLAYSHTVVAHIAKDGHYYIHPDINQNRSITPREAARLQTFPDDYYFESISGVPARTYAFRQIGNAVPVLLARKIADKMKEVW
ncbi:DNA cytosine methyltransferase [Chlorobaculum thiosulfatiphilum]|jgi:DNA (cytosine-5)-methyltransferase 1|uniref:Cytosine-specific methyltransferase n=1 Tax=Chlorobaculum thiosulfatiphilum TaxID=115852 RepID=A0A5C4S5K4_CHLTI|nr:DNA cytosine methyltransferase [Chlorobaculum thiosulfatiphilum]TNJ38508.1 DNA cytosine methyltransferase [Chlorobaculum thiosulfatiphilum]